MNKQYVPFIGIVAMAIGMFTPAVSVPIMGSVSILDIGLGWGMPAIALTVLTTIFVIRKSRWGYATATAQIIYSCGAAATFWLRMENAKAEMRSEMEGNMFGALGEIAMASVRLHVNTLALVVIGSALVLYGMDFVRRDD